MGHSSAGQKVSVGGRCSAGQKVSPGGAAVRVEMFIL